MQDLYLGLAVMALLSACAFALGYGLSGGHKWVGNGLAIVTVLLTLFYIRFAWNDIRLARLLPFSNLVVVGNWLPLTSTFLAGVVWRRIRHWRRVIAVAALWIAAGYAAATPLLATMFEINRVFPFVNRTRPPTCEDNWTPRREACLQTTSATCTPACAATLLSLHGIEATEGEMARLCLTTSKGTNWTGLYRGLKLKTHGTRYDVRVLSGSARKLLSTLRSPTILSVGLPMDTRPDSYYRTKWVWNPGEEHSVILLGINKEGMLQIIDPDDRIVFENWHPRDIAVLWRGQGMTLVERPR